MHVLLLSLLLSVPVMAAETVELPSGLPPTRNADDRRAVLELMKGNRQKYGEDAALLQGLLLTHSLQGQAVLTTESTIVGFEEHEGHKYVAFRVASGVVLNDKSFDREQRLERIWHIIIERTLLRYPKFTAPADGVAIEIEYNHRPYQQLADLYNEADDTGAVERAKFYMLSSDLSEFLAHQIETQDFLERSRVLLDDQPVKLRIMEVSSPPRPPTAEPR
ncbi:MAG TPA: hypothetical protein VLF14_06110 [Candidatus Binatia bacterium]|nr:hypothetical protein [Candidatus Binatia bacterium]